MKKFGIIAAVVVALIGAFIWYINQPDHYYRLGIEVETPDGLKSAASTLAIYQSFSRWGLPEAKGLRQRHEGEAVFLDLGNGKNLVALLAHNSTGTDYSRIDNLDNNAFRKAGQAVDWNATKDLSGPAPLVGDDIPTLVRFSDVNDVRSAKVVQPGELEAVLGPGYRFKRAWVEIAPGPQTQGISEHLPFLKTQAQALLAPRIMKRSDNYVPSMGQFKVSH